LIVAAHFYDSAEFSKILNQVVGKRVVIVQNEYHAKLSCMQSTCRLPFLTSVKIFLEPIEEFLPPEKAIPIPKGGIDGTGP
jgi:hypothetical protein